MTDRQNHRPRQGLSGCSHRRRSHRRKEVDEEVDKEAENTLPTQKTP